MVSLTKNKLTEPIRRDILPTKMGNACVISCVTYTVYDIKYLFMYIYIHNTYIYIYILYWDFALIQPIEYVYLTPSMNILHSMLHDFDDLVLKPIELVLVDAECKLANVRPQQNAFSRARKSLQPTSTPKQSSLTSVLGRVGALCICRFAQLQVSIWDFHDKT